MARPTHDVQTTALKNETETPAPTSIASGAVDVAPLGEATQSSTYMGMDATRATRGYRSSKQGFGSVGEYAHTQVLTSTVHERFNSCGHACFIQQISHIFDKV